ncbi:MAG: phospholipid carrier-dependent glycosyltransferase, partial [Gammaproteobacteria bacterium]
SEFGNSEFFMRLPHFLAAVLILLLIWQFVMRLNFTRFEALSAVAVVATTTGFLITAGVIMTDMFLSLSMVMAMVGFWRGWHGEKRYVYLMYAGLGFGLLIKGPLILVLAGLVILPWIVISSGVRQMWGQIFQRLNIFTGIPLMLLIATPWYFLAEQATPGFLEYFFVGEYYQRFFVSGWEGDLYGSGHARTRGTIWIYWFLFALPWSPFLLLSGIKSIYRRKTGLPEDRLVLFLVLWMSSPMVLFTFAGNILPAYIVPGLPAVGLLMIKIYDVKRINSGKFLLLVGPAVLLILNLYIILVGADKYSDKSLLENGFDSTQALYYLDSRPYSAQYYSDGKAKLSTAFPDEKRFYLAINKGSESGQIEDYCQLRSKNERRGLFFCQRDDPT